MKILHAIFAMETGGSETMLVDILNEQVKTEQVFLLIINALENEEVVRKIDKRVKIIRAGRTPMSRNPIPVLKLNLRLLFIKPDVIHLHNNNGIEVMLPCFHRKTNATIHDTVRDTLHLKSLKKYGRLFSISKAVQQSLLEIANLHSTLVYNGIYPEQIKVKTENNRTENIYKILQVSSLQHLKKGQNLLIEAANKLVRCGICNFHIDFIGEGKSEQYLKEMVQERGLEKYVSFLGLRSRDYVYQHLCDYDLFVQPSLFEGFGLTITEAMAAKVPVLVSDIEGPMEITGNGEFGWNFRTNDAESLSQKIEYAIAHKHDTQTAEIVERAYTHTCECFDVKTTAKRYIEEYKKYF
jgi:glycosyltransferase involved in cell wall biosynthesis